MMIIFSLSDRYLSLSPYLEFSQPLLRFMISSYVASSGCDKTTSVIFSFTVCVCMKLSLLKTELDMVSQSQTTFLTVYITILNIYSFII